MQHLTSFLSSLNLPLLVIGFLFWASTYAFAVTNTRAIMRSYLRVSTTTAALVGLLLAALWVVPFIIGWKTGLVLAAVCYSLEGLIFLFMNKRKYFGLQYVNVLKSPLR